MPAYTASRQLHELVPIMSFLTTAIPKLLQVVKDGLSFMILTGSLTVILIEIVLTATLVNASEFAFLGEKLFLLLVCLCCFLNFLLLF